MSFQSTYVLRAPPSNTAEHPDDTSSSALLQNARTVWIPLLSPVHPTSTQSLSEETDDRRVEGPCVTQIRRFRIIKRVSDRASITHVHGNETKGIPVGIRGTNGRVLVNRILLKIPRQIPILWWIWEEIVLDDMR